MTKEKKVRKKLIAQMMVRGVKGGLCGARGRASLEEKQPESLTFQPLSYTASDNHIIESITVSVRNSAPIVPSLRDGQTRVM